MKKIALVAALAAVAAPAAFAQSSVTLWGRINTTVESQKVENQDRKAVVQNNSSRLGFKGTEDLGGGLKASFLLEHGLNSDNGTATSTAFWNREAAVQLSGSFGAVKLGRWTNGSYFATADYVSMHNHDTGTSSDALYSGIGWTETNKVGYFTPNVAGFTGEFTMHAGEGVDKKAFDAALNYDMGPLHLGAGYSKQGDGSQYAIRGLYELGAFTFGGYYQREDAGVGARPTRNIGRVSAMYTMGASEFHVNVGGTESGGTFGSNGAKQYTVGYNYNLSKRTKVYGFYTAVDNTAGNHKGDFDSLAVGVRHNF
ncbi:MULTISPECIES: porin [unclassified Roseateles]|uniref:porin n=1 Tax=unclassified Roseateles TaxID=2626991 RepID=UPI000733A71B|nr:porin [Paucibacter sp. KCTC 42545]ALT78483.1 porin [Paucibacter sp. KCTC 42545]